MMIDIVIRNWKDWTFYSGDGWHIKLGNTRWFMFGIFLIRIKNKEEWVL